MQEEYGIGPRWPAPASRCWLVAISRHPTNALPSKPRLHSRKPTGGKWRNPRTTLFAALGGKSTTILNSARSKTRFPFRTRLSLPPLAICRRRARWSKKPAHNSSPRSMRFLPSQNRIRPLPAIRGSFPANSSTNSTGAGGGRGSSTSTLYSLPLDASWEPDLWGAVRNTVKADVFNAQASAATLENMRLTAQADLAIDYFSLRGQDALKEVLDATVVADQKSLDLTKKSSSRPALIPMKTSPKPKPPSPR